MVDAVGSVKQVVEVALMIKEAADTVRHNKKGCLQIKGRVNRLRAILSKLDDADAAKDPAIRDTLKDLKETLCRAYTLVAACREEKNIISLLFTAGKLSRQLREVNEDILAQMAVACFGSNVQTTIMLTKHFQDPSMDPEQMGLAFSFKDDADHVVRSSGSHSQHDTRNDRVEASDETGRATGVEPSSIPKKWHASLPSRNNCTNVGLAGKYAGFMGFIAPDLLISGCSSAKSDVYSYGILLLETISGQSCSQADSYFNTLSAWAWHLWNKRKLAEFIDPQLAGGVADVSQKTVIKRCIQIALLCVESDPAQRPTMSDVLHMLRDNKQKLPVPQRPACTDYGSNNYGSDDSGSYDGKIA